MTINSIIDRYKIEGAEDWRGRIDSIPYINFPSHWEVKVIPPYGGAMARFLVKTPGMSDDRRISVYLDMDDNLGACGAPYWEVYPCGDGETYRCAMADTDDLLMAIEHSLATADGEG